MHPLRDRFRVAAVTGTDGKTTTTTMVAAIADAAGERALRVTTLGAFLGEERVADPAVPHGFDRALEIALDHGARVLALEVTSQALAHGFARTFPPDVAVLASFSRDHLDFHHSREHYLASKSQLFLALPSEGTAILPAEEEAGTLVESVLPPTVRVRRYVRTPVSHGAPCDLAPRAVRLDRRGLSVSLQDGPLARALGGTLRLSLLSRVHVGNALAAAVAADALGLSADAIARGLASFRTVPGRMERVADAPLVLVDFAHTPSALEGTLTSARELADGAALCLVFGCGGDRDRGKRAEMGQIAARLADRVVVTSDNPRSEDPALIAAAIEAGARSVSTERARVVRELDRERAIERAIAEASPGDVVVIAGRGHEHEQIGAGTRRALSDREVAARAVEGRGTSAA